MTYLLAGLIGLLLGIAVSLWAIRRPAAELLEALNKSENNNRHMLIVFEYLADKVGEGDIAERVREKLLQ